jgi:hypothetical protein
MYLTQTILAIWTTFIRITFSYILGNLFILFCLYYNNIDLNNILNYGFFDKILLLFNYRKSVGKRNIANITLLLNIILGIFISALPTLISVVTPFKLIPVAVDTNNENILNNTMLNLNINLNSYYDIRETQENINYFSTKDQNCIKQILPTKYNGAGGNILFSNYIMDQYNNSFFNYYKLLIQEIEKTDNYVIISGGQDTKDVSRTIPQLIYDFEKNILQTIIFNNIQKKNISSEIYTKLPPISPAIPRDMIGYKTSVRVTNINLSDIKILENRAIKLAYYSSDSSGIVCHNMTINIKDPDIKKICDKLNYKNDGSQFNFVISFRKTEDMKYIITYGIYSFFGDFYNTILLQSTLTWYNYIDCMDQRINYDKIYNIKGKQFIIGESNTQLNNFDYQPVPYLDYREINIYNNIQLPIIALGYENLSHYNDIGMVILKNVVMAQINTIIVITISIFLIISSILFIILPKINLIKDLKFYNCTAWELILSIALSNDSEKINNIKIIKIENKNKLLINSKILETIPLTISETKKRINIC